MNAKKIMGAVLVALLAAALFVGAGAAADKGTVFVYSANSGLNAGAWANGAITVTVDANGNVFPGANFVAGTYKNGGDSVYFTLPTVSYAPVGTIDNGVPIDYLVENGKVYAGSTLALNAVALNKSTVFQYDLLVTKPNGEKVIGLPTPLVKGTYTVQAIFNETTSTGFIGAVPFEALQDKNILTFTVVGDEDATVSASADTVYDGEVVTFTIAGTPGQKYSFNLTGLTLAGAQLYKVVENTSSAVGAPQYDVTLENNGKAIFTAAVDASTAQDGKKAILEVFNVDNGKVTIKISSPIVTAALEQTSYFVGDEVKITGTATSAAPLDFYIKGTNFNKSAQDLETAGKLTGYTAGKTWEAKLATLDLTDDAGKKLDVGTYTITIKQNGNVVATLPLALKQPFISLTSAPEVVVQGTAAEFIGTAEATNKVYYYVFGTNYFTAAEVSGEDEFDGNKFTFEIDEETTGAMATGQYFVVVQHPMYDQDFNILPALATTGTFQKGDIVENTKAQAFTGTDNVVLFNVNDRQTANAAQALCDALDSQNIDDMYVKYAFIVAGKDQSFVVNEIPTEVVKGDKFTVSGTSTANEGDYVTVEMISTAFAAVPKETVGSASFITLSTKVAEDGTWEVTFDTSDLNVDEYSVKVACEGSTWKTVTVNVVEGADTPDTPDTPDVPDTPDTPDTPTEPTTPGFGALAALAGLGAVAVLLLRRE